eukprot:symbB.v1.2.010647.t1/scaffold701.1/size171414/3
MDDLEEPSDRTLKVLEASFTRSLEVTSSPKALREASFTREWHAVSVSQSTPKDENLDSDIKQHFQAVGELTQELDQLFAEMGQQSTVLKVGMRYECRIAAGLTRKLEIKVGEEVTDIQMACRLNDAKHLGMNHRSHMEETLLPPEPFALGVCDTARQAFDEGPYREWRDPDFSQALRFGIDSNSFFVNLMAKRECHVIFISKAITKAGTKSKMAMSAETNFNSAWTLEMQKLMVKVREHEDTKVVKKKTRRVPKPLGRRVEGRSKKALTFGELVFPEGRPAREQHQIEHAQLKVLQLWLGRSGRSGQPSNELNRVVSKVWAKLSPECPQKLAQKLVKTRQEQSVLTSIAIAGGFAFFLQRQRQLHLMRSRTALRQLAWYKALYSASRFLILAIFLNKGRQQAQAKRSGTLGNTPRRMSTRRRSSDAEAFFAEMSPLAMLRRYLYRRPGSKSSKGPSQGGSVPRPRMLRANVEPGTLAHHLLLQGFDIRPPESTRRRHGPRSQRILHQNQLAAKGLAARLGRQIQVAPKVVTSSNSQVQQAIQEVSQSTMMMTVSPRELKLMVPG